MLRYEFITSHVVIRSATVQGNKHTFLNLIYFWRRPCFHSKPCYLIYISRVFANCFVMSSMIY